MEEKLLAIQRLVSEIWMNPESARDGSIDKLRKQLASFVDIPIPLGDHFKYFMQQVYHAFRAMMKQRLCASLVHDGLADYAYSDDTDLLVYGVPRVLSKMEAGGNIQCTELSTVLNLLGMDFAQFVDFCILCGCDYNTRIYGIGPKRAHRYIIQGKTIESLPSHIDKECLRHERCRMFFSYLPSEHLVTMGSTFVRAPEWHITWSVVSDKWQKVTKMLESMIEPE